MSIFSLADELWSEILLYCDRSSLARLPACHSSIKTGFDTAAFVNWEALLQRDWCDTNDGTDETAPVASPSPPPPSSTPAAASPSPSTSSASRDRYRFLCEQFGRSAPHFKKLNQAWNKLEAFLIQNESSLPPIRRTLFVNPSLSTQLASLSGDNAATNTTTAATQDPHIEPPRQEVLAIGDLDRLITAADTEWRKFQVTILREITAYVRKEAEADSQQEKYDKRSQKRDRNSQHGSPSNHAANHAATSASSASSSARSGTSSDEPDQTMEFEASIGLPPYQPPVQIAEITAEESALLSSIRIPSDLLCSSLLHDGQREPDTRPELFSGLFGGFSFYSFITCLRLLSFADMLEQLLEDTKPMIKTKWANLKHTMKVRKANANKRRKGSNAAPTVQTEEEYATESAPADTVAMEDIASSPPASSSAASSFSSFSTSSTAISDQAQELFQSVMSTSLLLPIATSVVGEGVIFYLTPDGKVVRILQSQQLLHEVAPSFSEFFTRYVHDLVDLNRFRFDKQFGINRFPIADACSSDTTTNGIRIQVSVIFVPEQSTESEWFFTYQVRVTHDGTTPIRATLTTRHWKIEEENGNVNVVDGPGVVGFYPQMYANCPLFTYESCCPIQTRKGRMSGSFKFRDDFTGQEFEALIQPFIFDVDRNGV